MSKGTHDSSRKDRDAPLDERFVARLLEVAAEDQELSPEELAPIKSEVRNVWQQSLEGSAAAPRPRWRTALGLAAALVLAIGGALWFRQSPPVAHLAALSGSQSLSGFAVGTPLTAGARVATGARDRAALELTGGSRVRLDVDTTLRLEGERRLGLDRGTIYVEVEGEGRGLAIETPFGTVRDIGTRFEVRLSGDGSDRALRLRVRDGVVELDRGDVKRRVEAGSELLAGAVEETLRPVPTYGESWGWLKLALPPIEVEGLSLAAYLDWTTREEGWRLHYLDTTVAEIAAETRLHGSIAGLGPSEALELTVRGSHLDYRLVDGELTILHP